MTKMNWPLIATMEIAGIDVHHWDWVRFWEHVEIDPVGDDPKRWCWVWTGATRSGYGAFKYQREVHGAHRLLMEWVKGPLGLAVIDHLCGNRACVHPSHLDVTDRRENFFRGSEPHFDVKAK